METPKNYLFTAGSAGNFHAFSHYSLLLLGLKSGFATVDFYSEGFWNHDCLYLSKQYYVVHT